MFFRKSSANNNTEADSSNSWVSRLKSGLGKTRARLSSSLTELFQRSSIDDDFFEELENLLIMSDVGIDTSALLIETLQTQTKKGKIKSKEEILDLLKSHILSMLKPCEQPLKLVEKPFILLMVGINGVGKTTTTAKIAHLFKQQGKNVMLAAGDTFRAAAIEQLQVWGERNSISVIAQKSGGDSAATVFDAISSAKAKSMDLLIADTAGRLHTQAHLMAELQKIKRVIEKQIPDAPHEVLLMIDATTGQNALTQAQAFHEALGVTGLCITKLDGSSKGGILLAIANRLKLPIRFIGVGEGQTDLQPFQAESFVDALFD